MSSDGRERIDRLLTEALALLDADGATIAAIHVSQALQAVDYPVSVAARPDSAGEGAQSPIASSES